jgi:5-methylcytosine-specific restriction endonuclease McrA
MDIQNLPKTRAEAMAAKATHYFTGEPCKHGHIAPRKTKGACVDCIKVEWQKSNETRADYFKAYNKSEAGQEAKNRYYVANKDAVVAKARATPNELKNKYRQAWKDENLLAIRADTKARRRKHKQATPTWLTRKQKTEIRALYQAAIRSTQITGQRYVVDHIYPLRSDVVCGLHVPWNLRILTQEDNLRKSNTLPDDSEAIAFPPKK